MSSKLVIVADLQHFKLFWLIQDPLGRESLEAILSSDSLDIHLKPSEKLSDRLGHCETAWGIQGSGENHHMKEEEEHRRVEELAHQIAEALTQNAHEEWYFAAPKAIEHPILECLSPEVRKSLRIHKALDLTKIPSDEILKHFNA